MNIDEIYLSRCIEIAKNGLGTTAPNPMVGALIVHKNKIIGEGYTSAFGGSHAEVNAIASVKDKSLLKEATLYVTLEPCSHYGKTPPCADLIVKNNIPKVVIGLRDPHKKVAGKGIAKLKTAGIEVIEGILKKECEAHHRRFLTFQNKKRPYIILKWAESADGFIAPDSSKRTKNPEPYWITNAYSRQLVHQWRSEEQAVLVGTNTVLMDNPSLTVRDWEGKSPIRIVLDPSLRLPADSSVFDGSTRTMVIHDKNRRSKNYEGIVYRAIDFQKNVEQQICKVLHEQEITSVIIEGGQQTLQSFIYVNLWDEARVFKSAVNFKSGLKAPLLNGNISASKTILNDTLTTIRND